MCAESREEPCRKEPHRANSIQKDPRGELKRPSASCRVWRAQAGMHIGCAGSGDRYMFRARLLAEDAPPEDAEQLWADSMEALSSQGLCAGVLTDRDRNISNSTSRLLTLGAIAARVPLLTLLLRFEASNRAEMELAQPIPTELRRAPIPVKACSRAERKGLSSTQLPEPACHLSCLPRLVSITDLHSSCGMLWMPA